MQTAIENVRAKIEYVSIQRELSCYLFYVFTCPWFTVISITCCDGLAVLFLFLSICVSIYGNSAAPLIL